MLDPGFLAALFERRARPRPDFGEAADPSWYGTLATAYRARRHGSVDVAFGLVARALVLERVLTETERVRPGERAVAFCAPLSIRPLRLVLPASARAVDIELTGAGKAPPHAQLILPAGRVVVARAAGRSARLRAVLRPGEWSGARLLLTGRVLSGQRPRVQAPPRGHALTRRQGASQRRRLGSARAAPPRAVPSPSCASCAS